MSLKIRIPDAWAGRVHSEDVRDMLQAFLQRPGPLPPDPGVGDARVSLSVPWRAVKVLEGITGDAASAAMRRLIGAHLRALPSAPRMAVIPCSRPVPALPLARLDVSTMPVLPTSETACPSCAHATMPGLCSRCGGSRVRMTSSMRGQIPAEVNDDPLAGFAPLAGLALVVIVGACWFLWKKFGPVSAGPPTAAFATASELPRFAEWVPKGI